MKNRELQFLKKQLNEWLDALLHQSGTTINGMRQTDQRPIETIEQATMESDRNLSLRFRTREKFLIRKIQQSLQDIEAGEYGICDICGERISLKRLKVRPVTRHCIRCKTEMERKERLIGD